MTTVPSGFPYICAELSLGVTLNPMILFGLLVGTMVQSEDP